MERLNRVLAAVAVVCTIGALSAPIGAGPVAQYQSVRNVHGSITGVVSDDHGGPIAGAMVSALGTVTVAKAITDATGLVFDRGPADRRLHAPGAPDGLPGLGARDRARERSSASLAASSAPPARTARSPHRAPRPRFPLDRSWLPASVCPPARSPTSLTPKRPRTRVARDDHPHNETAWRLRHIKTQHPQGHGADRHRRRARRRHRAGLALRPRDGFRREPGDDVLHGPAVLGRSQPADDGRVRTGRDCSPATCCRAAWPTWRSARRRPPATGRCAPR